MKTNNPIIVIAVDPNFDDTVVSCDMVNGEKAIAKCAPEDEFDFGVGAKLALERLFQTKEKVNPCKFKVGYIVIGNEKAKKYAITCPGWVGRVVDVLHFEGCKTLIKVVSITNSNGVKFEVDPDAFDLVHNYIAD